LILHHATSTYEATSGRLVYDDLNGRGRILAEDTLSSHSNVDGTLAAGGVIRNPCSQNGFGVFWSLHEAGQCHIFEFSYCVS
jgi:hypothetical protein